MKLARKIDESASDVVGYDMVTRCLWESTLWEWKMVISILPRGLCVLEARDVRTELVPWMDRQL